jgi:uncharacterized repeat protein (TIGR01451 family)
MKKTLRLLTVMGGIFTALLSSQKADAQVTSISLSYNDSSNSFCNTPAPVEGIAYYSVQGTIQPLDSLTVYINHGDGTDDTYKIPTQQQGSFWVNHTYTTTGTFQISVTLTNTNSVTATTTGQTYTITNTCSAINGTVWIDNDMDCITDVGETLMSGHFIKLTNTTTQYQHYAMIDQNGMYHAEVPDGFTYDIELDANNYNLTPLCPVSGVATQAVSGNNTYTHNFGYECNSGGTTDFSVYGYGPAWRPGFNRPLTINAYTNDLCNTSPATVTLILDPLLSYVATAWGTPPSSISGQTITWNVSSLSQISTLMSQLQIYTDPSAVLGTTLCNVAYITYTGTDTIPQNDTAYICGIVTNSYDPNDKTVSPNVDAVGTIHNGDLLNYMIRFQNTGNDIAYNIVVVDTLSDNVDPASFHFIDASHDVDITWLPGNIINFRFENINLPDSGNYEPGSHGHIMYSVKAKTGLADGETINNTAYIYFDFNPAIITNTTLNTIDIPVSVKELKAGNISAKVYPNPANNELIVTTEGNNNFTATVYDVVGRSVAVSMTNHGKAVINTSSLANGMYILSIKAGGKDMTTKVNIQH